MSVPPAVAGGALLYRCVQYPRWTGKTSIAQLDEARSESRRSRRKPYLKTMGKKLDAIEYHRNILGITPPFDLHQLKIFYKKLIKKWHPDLFSLRASEHEEATEKTKLINIAFEFLSEFLESNGGIYQNNPDTHPTVTRPVAADRHYEREYQPKRRYEGYPYTEGFPDPSIVEIFLKSSHIVSAGYSEIANILYIKFRGDVIYRYFDVPKSVFFEFVEAESHGKYAHKYIYQSYRYERCS